MDKIGEMCVAPRRRFVVRFFFCFFFFLSVTAGFKIVANAQREPVFMSLVWARQGGRCAINW